MLTMFLYLTTILIWGSTWLAIHLQLGTVAPIWSVAYRFAIAAVILIGYCLVSRRSLRFTKAQHGIMALQGFFLFSMNYVGYYYGSEYFISGLVSVVFATILVLNIINARIFFKTPLQAQMILGALIGLVGLAITFSGEWQTLSQRHQALSQLLIGLGICLSATLFASWGNMVSVYNQRLKLPIIQTNAIAMLYGSLFVILLALGLGIKPSFDFQPQYIYSLLYLALVGTVLAFGAYLSLLSRIGPERAAYTFVLLPIIALLLSTQYENFHWTSSSLIGLSLVLIGNILVLKSKPLKSTGDKK